MNQSISGNNMLLITAGKFIMGSELYPNESPVRKITMSSFYIDQYPVTNADYKRFIANDGYNNPDLWSNNGWRFIRDKNIQHPLYWHDSNWNQDQQPVTGISWWEACAYATFVGKSLPTEAQWEYASRGDDGRTYPWGHIQPTQEYACYSEGCEPDELDRKSSLVTDHPKGISPFNCFDMAGNLAEWCIDNNSDDYSWDTKRHNPLYLKDENLHHIARGGSGLHDEDYLRCSSRDFYPPTLRDNIVGMRCVLNLKEGNNDNG